jgi:hypothetical protein
MTFLKIINYAALCVLLTVFTLQLSVKAQAQDQPQDLVPAAGSTVMVDTTLAYSDATHPPLRLTPDKSQIINLEKPVYRVVIGNETHINVLMDTSKRMIVVPRVPGATHFTLLDNTGAVMMQRHVIVASPKEKYIRIREACITDNCSPFRVFYCPGMCHEIATVDASGAPVSGALATDSGFDTTSGGEEEPSAEENEESNEEE